MDNGFSFGIVLGLLGGALIATNSMKARQLVRKGQDEVKNKFKEMDCDCKNNDCQ